MCRRAIETRVSARFAAHNERRRGVQDLTSAVGPGSEGGHFAPCDIPSEKFRSSQLERGDDSLEMTRVLRGSALIHLVLVVKCADRKDQNLDHRSQRTDGHHRSMLYAWVTLIFGCGVSTRSGWQSPGITRYTVLCPSRRAGCKQSEAGIGSGRESTKSSRFSFNDQTKDHHERVPALCPCDALSVPVLRSLPALRGPDGLGWKFYPKEGRACPDHDCNP